MLQRFTLTTSGKAVKRLRKAYAAQGTPWPGDVAVVALPGNLKGNTMIVGRSLTTIKYIAACTGGTIGVI